MAAILYFKKCKNLHKKILRDLCGWEFIYPTNCLNFMLTRQILMIKGSVIIWNLQVNLCLPRMLIDQLEGCNEIMHFSELVFLAVINDFFQFFDKQIKSILRQTNRYHNILIIPTKTKSISIE